MVFYKKTVHFLPVLLCFMSSSHISLQGMDTFLTSIEIEETKD